MQNYKTDESTIEELKTQLTNAELSALKSLQAEGIVGLKFKAEQKAMTNRLYQLVGSIRKRIDEKVNDTINK